MVDLAIAVLMGNILTLAFAWAMFQFHKHDYNAPWWAYAWVVIPILLIISSIILNEGLPPQLDALKPQ